MKTISKSYQEIAVELVQAWLNNESNVSNEIGRTSIKGTSVSVKEIAQAYLDFSYTIVNSKLPDNLTEETIEEDTTSTED